MSKKATDFQKTIMARIYKGKGIFKPLNTGWIDEHVGTVREWVANVFFYRKEDQVLMIDAGHNYERLAEKMAWLSLDPSMIHEILITVCSNLYKVRTSLFNVSPLADMKYQLLGLV